MKFRKLPVQIEAITFDELVQHGIDSGAPLTNGMPWSFEYKGQHISHENDACYLIPTLEGTMKFTPRDVLITGVNGEIYPCKTDIFEKTYKPVEEVAKKVEMIDILASIDKTFYFTAEQGVRGSEAGYGVEVPLSMCLLTFCVLALKNGFTVTGESACVNVETFNADEGKRIARAKAIDKIWPLLGYELRQKQFEEALAETSYEQAQIKRNMKEQAPEEKGAV